MRLFFIAALACTLFACATSSALAARETTSLDLSARGVAYDANRFVVTADGNVRVRLSDGTVITGETFSMDLKANRFLVAGNVRIDGPTIHQSGAAFSSFLNTGREYFIPSSGTPDRWTYFGNDYRDTHPGREQPGDAFFFPETTTRPYIKAGGAEIIPGTNARFDNAQILTAGVYIPLPRYVVTFSANPNFYQNGFAGARFDVGIPYNGSEHSLSALHIRNDAISGTYLSFDQHFVWGPDYIVISANPLTQEQKQYNLIGYDRLSPNSDFRGFYQLNVQQQGFVSRPLDAGSYENVQSDLAWKHIGFFTVTADETNWELLGIAPYDNYLHRRTHPEDALLSFTSNRADFGQKVPFALSWTAGLGYAHDQYGEGYYNGEQTLPNGGYGPPTLWYHFLSASLTTPRGILLGKKNNDPRLNFVATKQIEWDPIEGVKVESSTETASMSRGFDFNRVNTYLAYNVTETAALAGANQNVYFPAPPNVFCGAYGCFGGLSAFRGLSTSRGYTAGFIYQPDAYFGFSLTGHRYYDTPAPVQGYFGQPPWQLTADVHFRLARQIGLDLQRAYYFNFASLRWSPQTYIQFTP
jgi:hypothetical protein